MSQRNGCLYHWGKRAVVLATFILAGTVQAALPPKYQNEKDLDVMMEYIKTHPDVLSALQAIDLGSMTVYYGQGCSAHFARQVVDKPEGWVGPADPLIFIEAKCPEANPLLSEADDIGGITSRDTSSCGVEITEMGCQ